MHLEFSATHAQRDIAEASSIKEVAEVVAEPTLGHLHRGAAGLARHVDSLSYHTHLWAKVHTRPEYL